MAERELQVAAAEGSATNDRWMRRKDGTRFFASGITTALKDSSGELTGFSKVLRDITERKHAEEQLERMVAERTADLRATNEQLEAFVYQGTGIGLSVVRKGIERMGGRVGLESEPGKGSRFWIELPKATA